jgi:hypothetical protein
MADKYVTAAEEQIEIASPEDRERLKKTNAYGHDLMAAVARGWRRKAKESIAEAAENHRKASLVYGHDYGDRSHYAMTLSSWVRAAAKAGLDAAEIRRQLEEELSATHSLSIENIVASTKRED